MREEPLRTDHAVCAVPAGEVIRMDAKDKKLAVLVVAELAVLIAIVCVVLSALHSVGLAEEDYAPLYVTADMLNAREQPTKKAPVAGMYYFGDELQPTGKISKDREWVEVYGGEAGTMWVKACYVSERYAEFIVKNENNGKVKIRSRMGEGKVRGYVRNGQSIEIDRVVLGWGHCKKGWVDLEYFIEEVEHN